MTDIVTETVRDCLVFFDRVASKHNWAVERSIIGNHIDFKFKFSDKNEDTLSGAQLDGETVPADYATIVYGSKVQQYKTRIPLSCPSYDPRMESLAKRIFGNNTARWPSGLQIWLDEKRQQRAAHKAAATSWLDLCEGDLYTDVNQGNKSLYELLHKALEGKEQKKTKTFFDNVYNFSEQYVDLFITNLNEEGLRKLGLSDLYVDTILGLTKDYKERTGTQKAKEGAALLVQQIAGRKIFRDVAELLVNTFPSQFDKDIVKIPEDIAAWYGPTDARRPNATATRYFNLKANIDSLLLLMNKTYFYDQKTVAPKIDAVAEASENLVEDLDTPMALAIKKAMQEKEGQNNKVQETPVPSVVPTASAPSVTQSGNSKTLMLLNGHGLRNLEDLRLALNGFGGEQISSEEFGSRIRGLLSPFRCGASDGRYLSLFQHRVLQAANVALKTNMTPAQFYGDYYKGSLGENEREKTVRRLNERFLKIMDRAENKGLLTTDGLVLASGLVAAELGKILIKPELHENSRGLSKRMQKFCNALHCTVDDLLTGEEEGLVENKTPEIAPVKRGRGRPRKIKPDDSVLTEQISVPVIEKTPGVVVMKRKPGRQPKETMAPLAEDILATYQKAALQLVRCYEGIGHHQLTREEQSYVARVNGFGVGTRSMNVDKLDELLAKEPGAGQKIVESATEKLLKVAKNAGAEVTGAHVFAALDVFAKDPANIYLTMSADKKSDEQIAESVVGPQSSQAIANAKSRVLNNMVESLCERYKK